MNRPATKCAWKFGTMIETDSLMRDERIPYWYGPDGQEVRWERVVIRGVLYRKPAPCPSCGLSDLNHKNTTKPYDY